MRRVLVVTALVCALAPAGAFASKAGGERLIRDCAKDGQIDGHYSQADFRYALDHMPSDLDEYTNCREAIRAAQRSAAGGHRGGAPGGGSTGGTPGPPAGITPAERAAIGNASKNPTGPIDIGGGKPVTPGGPGITAAGLDHALPGSMLLALILLSIGALAAASFAVRNRVIARRQA
jgi:hypothetical protein